MSEADPRVGQVIDDRYIVGAVIGRGGMGAVYRATHLALDRAVAIKFLRPDRRDTDALARFRREAQTASRIDHVNVVAVHDAGTTEAGDDFLVMELLDGESLDQILRRGPIEPGRAIDITRQILRGLHAIHAAGVIHRDVKPGNVVLARGEDGEVVKLTDFGIAKPLQRGEYVTETGKVIGTVQFMAPEQLLGYAVDHRADLYAAGMTLYTMIAGEVPFRGETFTRIALARLRDAVPRLGELEAPAELAAVVMRAIEERPEDRYTSALDFEQALARLANPNPTPSRPRPPPDEEGTTRVERTPVSKRAPGAQPTSEPAPGSQPAPDSQPTPGTPVARPRAGWIAAIVIAIAALAIVAIVIATRATDEVRPRDGSSALDVARAAEARGDHAAAIAAYEAAQRVAPRGETWYRIGELEERRGDHARAARAFERYLDAMPDAADRDVVRARIARLAPPHVADAGVAVDAAITVDAGIAARPAPGLRCRCYPTDSFKLSGVGTLHLCKTKRDTGLCRCQRMQHGSLCAGTVIECEGCDHAASTCKDPRCKPNGWGCSDANYATFHLPGQTGDACRGFSLPTVPVELDGTLECQICLWTGPQGYDYIGRDGAPCRGWDQARPIERVGVLGDCR